MISLTVRAADVKIGDHLFHENAGRYVVDTAMRDHDGANQVVLYLMKPGSIQMDSLIFEPDEPIMVGRYQAVEIVRDPMPCQEIVSVDPISMTDTGNRRFMVMGSVKSNPSREYRIEHTKALIASLDDLPKVEEVIPTGQVDIMGRKIDRAWVNEVKSSEIPTDYYPPLKDKLKGWLTERQVSRMLHVAFIQNKQTRRVFDDWLTVKCSKPDEKGISRSYVSVHWREAKCDMTIAGRARDVLPFLVKMLNKGKRK
ncbi:hypothetical protein BcepF1.048 [Burkholderia phage BcepF1]|uniref:Uncharacterized protein n=1 Tax=Burkholderia phage BcepF1 TaxID=2886897 RepID=A1YZV2_9CAUD|nr:hypothetical protein BcepF1.048 [Burkholderia phage BcepF1]ABL96779.1 hypothetical protein BcepF1.048 [Burkholderia phage BcepF1]